MDPQKKRTETDGIGESVYKKRNKDRLQISFVERDERGVEEQAGRGRNIKYWKTQGKATSTHMCYRRRRALMRGGKRWSFDSGIWDSLRLL